MEGFDSFSAQIRTPFNMIISGPSNSGKTHFVCELIQNKYGIIDKDFDYILWFFGEAKPTIKEILIDRRVTFIKGLPKRLNEFILPQYNGLAVFDDLMTEVGNTKLLANFFTKKSHHDNISVIFLTQNYYSAGNHRISVRRNTTYLTLFKNPMDKTEAHQIGKKFMPGKGRIFDNIYKHAVEKPHGYLFIDAHQETPEQTRLRTDILSSTQRVFIPDTE